MKNLVFGLIATVMFGFVGNAQDTSKFVSSETNAKIVNKVLPIFVNKIKSTDYSNYENMIDNIIIDVDKNFPNVISSDEKKYYKNKTVEFFKTNSAMTTSNVNQLTNSIIKTNFSFKLQSVLNDSFTKNLTKVQLLDILNNLLKDKSLTSTDINFIEKLKSFLNSISINTSNTNVSARCSPLAQVVIASIWGEVIGGGMGAILLGSLVQHMQNSNGGGCI